MPHEGYADPVMNDGPGFRSNEPVSELTESVTRAIEASDVSSTPPVAEIADGKHVRTQESVAAGKSTKILSLQLTLQSDAGSGATPTGCTRVHPLASQKIPQTILPKLPGGSGATPTVCARAHPLEKQNPPR